MKSNAIRVSIGLGLFGLGILSLAKVFAIGSVFVVPIALGLITMGVLFVMNKGTGLAVWIICVAITGFLLITNIDALYTLLTVKGFYKSSEVTKFFIQALFLVTPFSYSIYKIYKYFTGNKM